MKFKKVILAVALTTVFSASFAQTVTNEGDIGNYIQGNNYGIVVEDLDSISNMMIASAINDAKIDGSINFNAEVISIDSSNTVATATATAVGGTSVSEALANAVSGNIFKTLVVGAQNTADLTASINSTVQLAITSNFTSDSSSDTSTTPDLSAEGAFGPGPVVQAMNAVTMAVNNFDLNASVNITSAIDTARLDGWVFDRTITDSLVSLDVRNLSISTTAVGAINNTIMSLSNINSYNFSNTSTIGLTTASSAP
jgi:hypothetical protein